MPSVQSLRQQGLALIEDQKKLIDDSRPWSKKQPEFDRLDADLKAVQQQYEALQVIDGQPFRGLTEGDEAGRASRGSTLVASITGRGYRRVGTPQLDLDQEQLTELHDAAVHKSKFSVDSKTVQDSALIDQGAIVEYRTNVLPIKREPTRVLSLLPTFAANARTIEWFKAVTAVVGATAVAEGAVKPSSYIQFDAQLTQMTKLAHWSQTTDEVLADVSNMAMVLQSELVAGLIDAENTELLNATVTGAHYWPGLLNTTGILTRAKSTEISLDTIEMAFDDLRGTSYTTPDGIIMNPATWGALRRAKDSQGRYYLNPDPTVDNSHTLFGVPVVVTTSIATGTVLVGAFQESTAVYVREGIRVTTNNSDQDDWIKNLTKFLAEERLALTVPRPSGLIKVTGIV